MNRNLPIELRIRRMELSQDVENIKARHAYLHGRCDGVTEMEHLWVHSDEIGWGHGFGCMKGYDQVWHGNVLDYETMGMENQLELSKIYPEVSGKDFRPLMECAVHTLASDVIEVADDCKSARASFFTPGLIHSTLRPQETKRCHILWERYGADFVLDGNELKYLNEQVCPDIPADLDSSDWAADDFIKQAALDEPKEYQSHDGPAVTYKGPWHRDYSLFQEPQYDILWPEPYETLDAEHRYNKNRPYPVRRCDVNLDDIL